MGRYDAANTGYAAGVSGPTEQVDMAWRNSIDADVLSSPAIADDTVYVTAGDAVRAFDTEDGNGLWKATVDGSTGEFAPMLIGDRVCVSGKNEGLYALDAVTGEADWSVAVPVSTMPIVANDTIYVAGTDDRTGLITALSPGGEVTWSFKVPADDTSEALVPPSVIDDTVYAAAAVTGERSRTVVYVVDAGTGEERWRFEIDGKTRATPAVSDDTIYVASDLGEVHAVDRINGDVRWTFDSPGSIRASPVLSGDVIVVGDLSGTVYAIEAASGDERWRKSTEIANIDPTASNDVIYVGGSPVYALSVEDGDVLWKYGLSALSYTFYSPAISKDSIYVGACVKWDAGSHYDNGIYKLAPDVE